MVGRHSKKETMPLFISDSELEGLGVEQVVDKADAFIRDLQEQLAALTDVQQKLTTVSTTSYFLNFALMIHGCFC